MHWGNDLENSLVIAMVDDAPSHDSTVCSDDRRSSLSEQLYQQVHYPCLCCVAPFNGYNRVSLASSRAINLPTSLLSALDNSHITQLLSSSISHTTSIASTHSVFLLALLTGTLHAIHSGNLHATVNMLIGTWG